MEYQEKYILVNPKLLDAKEVVMLPDRLWRRLVELSIIVGDSRSHALPSVDDISWILRVPICDIELDLKELKARGFIENNVLLFRGIK